MSVDPEPRTVGIAPIATWFSGPVFSRARDIFAANMTDLLDRAEDPARMIRMIILEMEETLVDLRTSAARSIADAKEMKRLAVAGVPRDERAAALLADQDVRGDQLVDRAPQRPEADAEPRGEPALRRNRRARLPFAVGQRVGQPPLDVPVQGRAKRRRRRRVVHRFLPSFAASRARCAPAQSRACTKIRQMI